MRLANIDAINPAMVTQVEAILRKRLSSLLGADSSKTGGLEYLVKVLTQVDRGIIGSRAGGAASLFQIWPAPDAMVHGVVSNFHPEAPLLALRSAFFPHVPILQSLATIIGAAIVVAASVAVSRSRGTILILWGSYAVLTFIFILKWVGGVRHLGFVLLLLLFALWIAEGQAQRAPRRPRPREAEPGLELGQPFRSRQPPWGAGTPTMSTTNSDGGSA